MNKKTKVRILTFKEFEKSGFKVEYGSKTKPHNALIYFSEGPYIEILEKLDECDENIINDSWHPVFSSPGYVRRYKLDIYNRWGGQVFETTDVSQGWDCIVVSN